MPASLCRISFMIRAMWIGLISALLSPAGSRHSLTLPFTLWMSTKLLHCLDVSSTPSETIICCLCSLSNTPFSGSCKEYATLLGGTYHIQPAK